MHRTFKKVLFQLIVCERNLQRSPVLQANVQVENVFGSSVQTTGSTLSRIIYYIELETFYRNAFSSTLRFENEYAETNIPIVPWHWQQCGGETIGRIVLRLEVCAKASTHKFHANGMAMTKTFCMTFTIRLLKTQSHEITLEPDFYFVKKCLFDITNNFQQQMSSPPM